MTPPVELTLNAPLPPVLELVGGEYRVKGHRITLYHVLSAADQHWLTPEAMVFYYPTLSYDEIRAVFAFYDANRAAVDQYVREYKAALDEQQATLPRGPSKADLLARLEALKAERAASAAPVAPAAPAKAG